VTSIVLSTQHLDEDMTSDDVRAVVEPYIREVLPEGWITEATQWWVNPTGKFVIGGPDGDAGLTGRKIIVDTYGGAAPHGGGAFSGKDPTKVDRSAAYAARYLAKNVVAAGLAKRCTIQLSYAIGVAEPLSIYADTHGTGEVPEEVIEAAIGRSWTSRRAASARICSSTARSTSARRPMAISAARRRPMAGSRGNGQIWLRRSRPRSDVAVAQRAFDVDANGAARLQPGQGQAFNPTDVEVAMHEDRVAVPAQADIRRCDIGHAVGGFRLEDRLRQCRAARWHAPVGLLQNENIRLAFQQDLLHPLGVAPLIEAHGLADVVAYDLHRGLTVPGPSGARPARSPVAKAVGQTGASPT
jgi:hypothetical protein